LEFDEFLPDQLTAIDLPLQEINLIVAAITNFACLYLVIVLAWWWFRLRVTRTYFRPFIFGVWLAKLSIWFWSLTGLFQIVVLNMTQPLLTLPARIGMMIAVVIMVWVTTHYYAASRPDGSLF
jgi:hypothetical protein